MSESSSDYFVSDPNDLAFGGAKNVIEKERQRIKEWRGRDPEVGISLSGGGIRSASFSLGVLQALAYWEWLPKFDYMSTVSGGGYIGSSLSYLLHRKWGKKTGNGGAPVSFDVSKEKFPYLSFPMAGNNARVDELNWKGTLLRRLRQNASYLAPGDSITMVSLFGVVLRNTIVSAGVHLAVLVLTFSILLHFGLLGTHPDRSPAPDKINLVLLLSLATLALFCLISIIYVWMTIMVDACITHTSRNLAYKWRRRCEQAYHYLLIATAASFAIAVIPQIYKLVNEIRGNLASISFDEFSLWLSGALTIAGIVGSVWSFARTGSTKKSRIPTSLIVSLACSLLLFGLLLLSFTVAVHVTKAAHVLFLLFILFSFGWLPNVNYVSVHRYYRDRLMEAFLPDVPSVLAHPISGKGLTESGNTAMLHELCAGGGGPYHIINCNVVLVSSLDPKYRGRGGDNFILSPLFIGSNATGWKKTPTDPGNCLTLATAMAISGAAVNPDTGCGGEGITRKPVLSVLMSLLNIRLGYWMANPGPSGSHADQPGLAKFLGALLKKPNLINPGLKETFNRKNLRETAPYLLVTDGGHFENLGLYELVRRRLKLIVVCDGAADPKFTFSDLANAIEKVRADFGAIIDVSADDLEALKTMPGPADGMGPGRKNLAQRGYLLAPIIYPAHHSGTPGAGCCGKPEHGLLIYLTTTFFAGLSADLGSYREEHPEFPDEPTSNQFFDEKQFEAYRELGYQTAWAMMSDIYEKYLQNADWPEGWKRILVDCFGELRVSGFRKHSMS